MGAWIDERARVKKLTSRKKGLLGNGLDNNDNFKERFID